MVYVSQFTKTNVFSIKNNLRSNKLLPGSDNASSPPHQGDSAEIQIPFELLWRFSQQHETLRVGDDFRGVQGLNSLIHPHSFLWLSKIILEKCWNLWERTKEWQTFQHTIKICSPWKSCGWKRAYREWFCSRPHWAGAISSRPPLSRPSMQTDNERIRLLLKIGKLKAHILQNWQNEEK